MGENVRIGPDGSITITTSAWLRRSVGEPNTTLTMDLRLWASLRANWDTASSQSPEQSARPTSSTDEAHPLDRRQWGRAAMAWCRRYDDSLDDSSIIVLSGNRLDAHLWIIRFTDQHHGRLVAVGIDDCEPVVFAETCTDPFGWYDADSVDIICPGGHRWTWRAGREIITSRGAASTLSLTFGPTLDAPFTPCPLCAEARSSGRRGCGCDGTPWILCPTCGRRCDIDLPL